MGLASWEEAWVFERGRGLKGRFLGVSFSCHGVCASESYWRVAEAR